MKVILERWNKFRAEEEVLEEGLASRLGGALLGGALALSSVAKAGEGIPNGGESTEQSANQGISQEQATKAIAWLKLMVDSQESLEAKVRVGDKLAQLAWKISLVRDGKASSLQDAKEDQKVVDAAGQFDKTDLSSSQRQAYLRWAGNQTFTGEFDDGALIVGQPLGR